MFCSKCGAALGANDKFCSKCGEVVSTGTEQAVPTIAPVATPSTTVAPSTSFRDPTKLTTWLKYFLYASIILDAVALFSGVLQYQLLSDFKLGVYPSETLATEAAGANDKRQQIIGVFQFGISITTMILFAMWIYRANFNSRALGAQDMKFTPGWAVGYYFIPFLNLWRPYQAMKEIWKASKNPSAWVGEERSTILPWWWLFFLVTGMLSNASFRISMSAKELNELITATGITLASDLMSIPATIIALVLVGKIHEMQMSQERAQMRHAATTSQSSPTNTQLLQTVSRATTQWAIWLVVVFLIIGVVAAVAIPAMDTIGKQEVLGNNFRSPGFHFDNHGKLLFRTLSGSEGMPRSNEQTVLLPDGTTLAFQNGMSPDAMSEIIRSSFPEFKCSKEPCN